MNKLYADVTGITSPISINVSENHGASTSTAIIECVSHSLDIGDSITVDMGFTTDHDVVFTGYVKDISRKVPNNTYTITANDVMTRAVDYFIASSNPDQPYSKTNILAEDLVRDLMEMAGLNDFNYDPTYFTLAVNSVAEVNLVGAYDYANSIADLIAWSLYADEAGTVQFVDRKPYVVDSDTPFKTLTTTNFLSLTPNLTEKELRNRVVVYGSTGVYAEAKRATSYNPVTGNYEQVLPSNYYKTAVASSSLITVTALAQDAADYNLELYNRLQSIVSATILGDTSIRARKVIHVTDTITGIDGDYYIFMTEHSWSNNGYIVNLELRG